MNIAEFSQRHALNVKRDQTETIVPGKCGLLYEYNDELLAVAFMGKHATSRRWNRLRELGTASGMTLLQDGDSEGCLSFDPADGVQSKLAIQIAGVKRKRQLSPAERLRRSQAMRVIRRQPSQEGPSGV